MLAVYALYGACNGLLTIARGTLPLALFDYRSYGAVVGGLLIPSFLLTPPRRWPMRRWSLRAARSACRPDSRPSWPAPRRRFDRPALLDRTAARHPGRAAILRWRFMAGPRLGG